MSTRIGPKAMSQILVTIAAAVGGREQWASHDELVNKARVWCAVVGDVDEQEVYAAAMRLLATARFFPAASELRDEIMSARDDEDGLPTPEECWGEVQRALSRDGRYRRPRLPEPLLKAVDQIGWDTICDSGNTPAIRAQLRDAYASVLKRRRRESAGLPSRPALAGRATVADEISASLAAVLSGTK